MIRGVFKPVDNFMNFGTMGFSIPSFMNCNLRNVVLDIVIIDVVSHKTAQSLIKQCVKYKKFDLCRDSSVGRAKA